MNSRIRKCRPCDVYTMRQTCPLCGGGTSNTFPPRYSPCDRFGKYRRMSLGEGE